MTTNMNFLLQRAYEHLVAGVAAITVTTVLLLSTSGHADARTVGVKPTVTILVPTVTIEAAE
jgi:hypothetical protein